MHHWGGLDSLRAQSCHVCNQQNYYKKAFFRMYVRIKSQPTISQVYNKLKNWQHPEKNNKNDNHFFIVILLFQMLWLNEYFLSIIFYRLDLQGKNIREEPKGIVFLSKLLLLFQFCHLCFFSKPKLSVSQTGTLLTVESFCRNCSQTKVWKSQPDLLGKFPAGNLLLSFAVLCEPSEKKETIH